MTRCNVFYQFYFAGIKHDKTLIIEGRSDYKFYFNNVVTVIMYLNLLFMFMYYLVATYVHLLTVF